MTTRELTYVKAFNEGMHQVMAADPDVFLIGEDVAGYGGVFHMFDGLLTEFGDKRVKDTPIAEQAIIGLGVGAAARGLRPVCDLMFMDFVGVAMDQIFNQAAKMKYMFGGGAVVPLTITTAGGGGMSAAAQHSQSLEAWLAHIPGLKVAMPASPYDAKGLIVGAIRDDNPTIVVMNKKMLGIADYGLVAGGPAGTALVIVREDLVGHGRRRPDRGGRLAAACPCVCACTRANLCQSRLQSHGGLQLARGSSTVSRGPRGAPAAPGPEAR